MSNKSDNVYGGISVMSGDDARFYRDITENSQEAINERIKAILKTGSALYQLRNLTYDEYAKRDMVSHILKNGPYIINIMHASALEDKQGNCFVDFLEDDAPYFSAMESVIGHVSEKDAKENKEYISSIKRAIQLRKDLLDLIGAGGGILQYGDEEPGEVHIDEDEDHTLDDCVEGYNAAANFILSCANYEVEKAAAQNAMAKLHVQGAMKKYIAEQTDILHSYFSTYMRDVNALIPLVEWDDLTNFEIDSNTLVKYKGRNTNVVIPNIVRKIGKGAFEGNTTVQSVVIPGSGNWFVIGESAFGGCTGLTKIDFTNVTSIDSLAFHGCTGLTELNIPKKVGHIGNGAFRDCTGLTNINIAQRTYWVVGGTSLKHINGLFADNKVSIDIFEGCTNLKTVTMPGKLKGFLGANLKKMFGEMRGNIKFTFTKDKKGYN